MSVERMIPYELVGNMKGKSGKFFGFKFVDGKAMIPESAHKNCGHVLRDDFSARPVADINADPERIKKALALLEAEERKGSIPATPTKAPEKEEQSEAERLEQEEREAEEARIAAEQKKLDEEAAARAEEQRKKEAEEAKAAAQAGKGKGKNKSNK